MATRVGVCRSCGAQFRIPATFAHDRARCRTCGGVVEIGPPEGIASVAPAAPADPAPAPEVRRVPEPPPAESAATIAASIPTAMPVPVATPARGSRVVAIVVGAVILALIALGAWKLLG